MKNIYTKGTIEPIENKKDKKSYLHLTEEEM